MAYVTGSAASYTDLLTALRSACTANGWTLTGNILSKSGCYVNTEYVSNLRSDGNGMPRILLRASNDSTLTDTEGSIRVGFGHYGTTSARGVQFSCTYHIFINTSPDEVYMVVVYNTNHHQWLAFGKSPAPGITGTGNWAAGTLSNGLGNNTTSAEVTRLVGDTMKVSLGYNGGGGGNGDAPSAALFFNSLNGYNSNYPVHNVQIHIGNIGQATPQWAGPIFSGTTPAYGTSLARQLMQYSPSTWSQEGLLIPITPITMVGNNVVIVGNIAHARYFKINNYAPGDIITQGSDRWKVFPWYIKGTHNSAAQEVEDSGLFGWAIRYDGP